MRKLFVFLFLFFMLLMGSSFAAPPQYTNTETATLSILVPHMEYVEYNAPFSFVVHVFNSTGHFVTNSTTDCTLHIFNTTGDHLLDESMVFDTASLDFYYDLNNSFTDEIGMMPFIVQCNNTEQGGFFADSLEINKSTHVTNGDIFGLSILLIGLLFFFVYLSNCFKDNSKWFHQGVRLLLILLSVWLVVLSANLGVGYAVDNVLSDSIISTVQVGYKIAVYFAWIFSFMIVLYFLYEVLMAFRYEKEEKESEILGE